ncbi:hypothetical protein J4447_01040 [Candidatus Pacearchaeota archaeon]|nr:hypothetical protein [Candidatus Pacearchaeota archaeon]
MSFLLAAHFVSAFGVTSFYYEGRPLVMMPGESRNISLILQNMVGNDDMKATAEITEGREIAVILDGLDGEAEYLVPLGVKDVQVNIQVSMPSNARRGERYEFKVLVGAAPINEGEGQLGVVQGIVTTVPVYAGAEEKKIESTGRGYWRYALAFAVAAAIIIVVIAYIRKRKSLKDREFYAYQ